MMKLKKKITWLFALVLLLISGIMGCKQQPVTLEINKVNVIFDSLKLVSYADTIVCDMVVKNPEEDDVWMDSCLRQLKRADLVNEIFNDIYSGELTAYDFYSHKPLSIKEVKKIETISGYSRDIIGKFQFREVWHYDKTSHVFIKKVHSITFGYETYDDRGFVKGYKPLFNVKF